VPQNGNGRSRRPITLKDVRRPRHVGIFDVGSAHFARDRAGRHLRDQDPPPSPNDRHVRGDGPTRPRLLQHREVPPAMTPSSLRGGASTAATDNSAHDPQSCSCAAYPKRRSCTPAPPTRVLHGSIGVAGSASHKRYYPGATICSSRPRVTCTTAPSRRSHYHPCRRPCEPR
jgi:hypothetical protein